MLKREVCKQVELAYADFEKPFRISTDASVEGLGAVLEQQDDIGNWRPLAYGSRRVTDAEKRYDAHKLEFLALKWAVTEQFSEYLTSSKFTVFTDNNPLTYILKKTHLDAIAQRWVAALADYDFEIIYKPGIENGVADALSRRYDEERDDTNKWIAWATRTTKNFKRDDDDCETVMKIQTQMNIDWKEEQKHDDDIRMIMDLINGSDEKETSNKFTADQRKMRRILPKFFLHNELLYYREDVEDVLVVPRRLQRQIATEYHANGHFGRSRTVSTLRSKFFWLHLRKAVETVIQSCERCQRRKRKEEHIPLNHLKEVVRPFECISMDYLSIDVRREEKWKILTIIDHYTRFGMVYKVKSEKANEVRNILYREVFPRFGIPQEIHTDQGRTFISKALKHFYKAFGIQGTTTTRYRPTGNSICERFNQTVINALGTLDPDQKKRWWEQLPTVEMAYNTTVCEATGSTSFMMMFHRTARTPIDCMIGTPEPIRQRNHNFTDLRKDAMRKMCEQQAKVMADRAARNEKMFGRRVKNSTSIMLQPGDRVLLKKVITRNKIDDKWEHDIYIVQRKVSEPIPVYEIKSVTTGKLFTAHREHIIRFQDIPDDGNVEQCKKECLPKAKRKKTAQTIRSDTEDDEDQNDTFYIPDLRGNVVENVNDDTNDEESEYDSNTDETDTDDDIESSDDEHIEETRKSDRLRRQPDRYGPVISH